MAIRYTLILIGLLTVFTACGGPVGTGNITGPGSNGSVPGGTGNTGTTPGPGGGTTTQSTEDKQSEQVNGGCPLSPAKLTGTGAVGASCTSARECKPACCDCSVGWDSWLAAACVNGKCSDGATACSKTRNDTFYCQ